MPKWINKLRSRQELLIAITLLFFLISSLLLWFIKQDGGRFSSNVSLAQKQDTIRKASKENTTASTKQLSSAEYKNLELELNKLVDLESPRVALEKIRVDSLAIEGVQRSCHPLVHSIGQAAYNKYKSFAEALSYKDGICNSGYLHGVIESHFLNSTNLFETINSTCSSYNPEKFVGWECFHGIGHGLMYFTSNNLPYSLSYCGDFLNEKAKLACSNGVFMENFNTDRKIHPSNFLKTEDPFYPCQEQRVEFKSECYLYPPVYHLSINNNDYQKTFTWCQSAEEGFKSTCLAGAGAQMMKENLKSPKFAEEFCMKLSDLDKTACLHGAVFYYMNHFGGIEEAEVMCRELETLNRLSCGTLVSEKKPWFE
jgi:hypothetical protein